MKLVKEISVFFPAFNEAGNIRSVVEKALQVLEDIAEKYEVIVVNDGSADTTEDVVKDLIKKHKHVKLLSHERNKGYGGALKSGIYNTQYELIAFNDGDGQFDFNEIRHFIPKLQEADIVVGYRVKRSDPFFRLLNAKLYGLALRMLFGLRVRDIDCAFKVLKRDIVDKMQPLQSNGAVISAEMLIKAQRAGAKIAEIPVNHYPRLSGSPTGASIRVILRVFPEIYKLYKAVN